MRLSSVNRGLVVAVLVISGCASAPDRLPADPKVSDWMIKQEEIWAKMACGGATIANDIFADDFAGTAPNGGRYGKPAGQPAIDPDTKWHTDCRLDKAEVRFYGVNAAEVFGAESKTVPLEGGKQESRCLVWTDTWLRRHGRWQMIAAQDSRIVCPPTVPTGQGP